MGVRSCVNANLFVTRLLFVDQGHADREHKRSFVFFSSPPSAGLPYNCLGQDAVSGYSPNDTSGVLHLFDGRCNLISFCVLTRNLLITNAHQNHVDFFSSSSIRLPYNFLGRDAASRYYPNVSPGIFIYVYINNSHSHRSLKFMRVTIHGQHITPVR